MHAYNTIQHNRQGSADESSAKGAAKLGAIGCSLIGVGSGGFMGGYFMAPASFGLIATGVIVGIISGIVVGGIIGALVANAVYKYYSNNRNQNNDILIQGFYVLVWFCMCVGKRNSRIHWDILV